MFVEHAGEIFWLNRNAKGELWVNAKASKYADTANASEGDASESTDEGKKTARRPAGGRAKKSAEQSS